ncbi:MAG: DUF2325 domain-containing protein [Abditibacteriales bacterium]|nr:DUF2325 domain-containing protein [Abditibacteriales bacterium]MDW8366932.1 DUF2325 domain-containing protein [Abditibacteriales bacterium]
MQDGHGFWSDALGQRLLAALSAQDLAARWGMEESDNNGSAPPSVARLRGELLSWARADAEVQRWLMSVWREMHADVVNVVRQADIEDLAAQYDRLLAQFDPEDILLALISDEHDNGWELADWFIGSVRSDAQRRRLQKIMRRWREPDRAAHSRRVRVVIFGGHPRDESKMTRRLFERSAVEVIWKICDKKQRFEVLDDALRHADAVLIVTSQVSHTLMEGVKRCANLYRVPWRCIHKATDNQLKAALRELFPDVAQSLPPK